MAQRGTHEALLVSAINSGKVRGTHEALLVSTVVPTGKVRASREAILISVTQSIVSISYPLSPPTITGLGPQDITLREVNVNGETESPFTLSQQIQQWPGNRFEIDATLPPMLYQQAEQWLGFLGALYGKWGTFLMGDYNRPTPQGPMTGAPQASGSNNNGSGTLTISGATPSVTGWAKAGDYVQVTVSGTQRIYKVLLDAASDISGNVSLSIFPYIRESIPIGTNIITSNCKGTFRLQENTLQWKIDKNKVYTISFKAKEAF